MSDVAAWRKKLETQAFKLGILNHQFIDRKFSQHSEHTFKSVSVFWVTGNLQEKVCPVPVFKNRKSLETCLDQEKSTV